MMRFLTALVCAAFLAAGGGGSTAARAAVPAPEPNPPVLRFDAPEAPSAGAGEPFMAPLGPPGVEWSFHKTTDGQHPNGNEQQLVWLANRARTNPTQEGIWLAGLEGNGGNVADARSYFQVNTAALEAAFAAIAPRPPAAFDVRLYNAAKAHSDYLISTDTQSHTGQFARVDAAGFKYTTAPGSLYALSGIVFSYSQDALYGHAAFNIDWGDGPNGMQDPPGHREAIMSTNSYYSNVGYAVVLDSNPATDVGPQVTTGNYAYANTGYANHYNVFIVGTVWEDTNGNQQYDPGEGLSGVTVMPDGGTYYAVTGVAGGYAIPVTPGTYTVTFTGGELNGTYTRTVTIGSSSVLQDLEYFSAGDSATNPGAWYGTSIGGGSGSSGGDGGGGGGGGCFLQAAGTGASDALPWAAAVLVAASVLLRKRA